MCDCLKVLRAELKPRGLWISSSFGGQVVVATEWYPGQRPKNGERRERLLAVFCPFCGERYEESDDERLRADQ